MLYAMHCYCSFKAVLILLPAQSPPTVLTIEGFRVTQLPKRHMHDVCDEYVDHRHIRQVFLLTYKMKEEEITHSLWTY